MTPEIFEYVRIRSLEDRNIAAERQVEIPLIYKSFELHKKYRIDILVENELIIEVKAVDAILPVHEAQIISYLKLADKKMGFLINFNATLLKQGFRRFVNGY